MKHIKLLAILCLLLMLVCCFAACLGDDTGDGGNGGNGGDGGDGGTAGGGTEQVCTHEYTDVVTAPTCTAAGYTTHTCSKCGDVKKDTEVSATGHDYKDTVTAPTCTKDGYTTHTCSACQDSYKDTPVKLTGHSWNYAAATASSVQCQECTTTYGWTTSVTFTYENYYQNSQSVGYTLSGLEGTMPNTLNIPAVYNGKPVMGIGADFLDSLNQQGKDKLMTLVIPDSVIDLGDGAFYNCRNLATIKIPNTLQHIGSNPFSLTKYEFNACQALGHNNTPYQTKDFVINGIYLIEPLLDGEDEYKVSEGIELIADEAFPSFGVSYLETVTLPKTLRYLGSNVFGSCTALKTLNIHKGVVAFGDDPLGDNHNYFQWVNFEGTQNEWKAIENWENFGWTNRIKYSQTIA